MTDVGVASAGVWRTSGAWRPPGRGTLFAASCPREDMCQGLMNAAGSVPA
jgi:hypothetical protein